MTTLDDDTKLNELRGILSRALKHHTRLSTMFDDPASDVTSWADLELCLRKAVGMTDALSSLPAQAVGDWRCAKCGCHSFARVDRLSDSGKRAFEPGDDVRCVNCKDVSYFPAPFQPAAVGVTDEMVEAIVQAVRPYTHRTLFLEEHRDLVRTALRSTP